ncbi:heterokaryon incompatibility protein-domain-containing protein [Cladorrhinum sp. PSN332]|nr:heterokaryon incompatibility protein-domain-containing protein [Cladorrhinum sp. PSN332]
MALCSVCEALPFRSETVKWDEVIETNRARILTTEYRYNLPGNFGELETRMGEGCEGCHFFYDRIRGGNNKSRIEPLTKLYISYNKVVSRLGWFGIRTTDPSMTHHVEFFEFKTTTDLEFRPDFLIPTNPSDEASWKIALGWLKTCTGEHATCAASAVTPILPKRIIELAADEATPPRLVLPPSNTVARFVALSHCWGSRKKMTKLTTKNESIYQEGIDLQSLSRNFRDAITITRRLGIRYVWIDALCILQDSTADWVAEAPKMTDIFGTATLVLSATSAKHCDAGILRPRLRTCSPPLGPSKNWFLMVQTRSIEGIISFLPLSSRGWAAQERMVAQRVLHYTPQGMFWECNTHLCAEPPWIEVQEPKRLTPKLVARWHHHTRRSRAPEATELQQETEFDAYDILMDWFGCIEMYSGRELTFPSDKLPAVAGLAAIFELALPGAGQYLAGLWSGHIVQCLAWYIRSSSDIPWLQRHVFRAPSWSWATNDCLIFFKLGPEELLFTPPGTRLQSASDVNLVGHQIIPTDGDGPRHLMGAKEGSYIVLEASCVEPSYIRKYEAPFGWKPNWKEYPSVSRPDFEGNLDSEGNFKFLRLGATLLEDDVLNSREIAFWGLYLHRKGPGSDFRRIGFLECNMEQEGYNSLPWKHERVKMI